jgi:hypothetical protein
MPGFREDGITVEHDPRWCVLPDAAGHAERHLRRQPGRDRREAIGAEGGRQEAPAIRLPRIASAGGAMVSASPPSLLGRS